jgi:hypothetical protein
MAEGDGPVQLPAYAAGPGGTAPAAAGTALPVRPGSGGHPGRLPRDCPGDKVCMQCCGTGTGSRTNHSFLAPLYRNRNSNKMESQKFSKAQYKIVYLMPFI